MYSFGIGQHLFWYGVSGGSGSSGSTSGEYEHTEAELAELGIDLETFQLDPYDEYKKLTQDEVILIMRFPLQALEIRKNAGIAEKETKAIFGKNGRHDKSDAFRHCYFNILNSISCGVVLARRFGNAHEERSDQSALEKSCLLYTSIHAFGTLSALKDDDSLCSSSTRHEPAFPSFEPFML